MKNPRIVLNYTKVHILTMLKLHYKIVIPILTFFLLGCASHIQDFSYNLDSHVSLGVNYLQQGNLENARLALNQGVAENPDSPVAWYSLAYLEELCGNFNLAVKYYRHSVELAPQFGEAHNNYGIFLCQHDSPQQGIKELLLAAQLPSYIHRAAAYENAGLCALKIPDRAAARLYFNKAKQNDPGRKEPDV